MNASLRLAPRTGILLDLLRKAQSGSAEALGECFEACRGYLLALARQELQAALKAKVDGEDLVQETFIEAMRDFATFRGQTESQLLSWLRGILRHNLTDLTRRFEACRRSVSQEVGFSDQLAGARRANTSPGMSSTICEQLIAREQRRALDASLQRLPPSYRQVLHLRFSEHCSFADIGNRLQRSPEATRKLWHRALERLRHDMHVHGHI